MNFLYMYIGIFRSSLICIDSLSIGSDNSTKRVYFAPCPFFKMRINRVQLVFSKFIFCHFLKLNTRDDSTV